MLVTAFVILASMPPPAAVEALRVAEEYVNAYFAQFPEEAFEAGFPDAPQDRFSDKSALARAAWETREDAWLSRLRAIDPAALEGTAAAVPYEYTREWLEATVEKRVCRLDVWNVSTAWGWLTVVSRTLADQPVSTPLERANALARVRDVARGVDTETANLREGLRQGFTAPRSNVDAVLLQVDAVLAAEVESSPFYSPAARDESGALAKELPRVIEAEILPAVRRHRDFLAGEYRGKAREATSVSAHPDGAACYAALLRFFTGLPLGPREIHENGLRQMKTIQDEMREIARRSFDTEDVPGLLQRLRTERRYTFGSAKEILDTVRAAIDRAEAAMPRAFGFVPDAEVVVRPYPAYQKRTGGGFYSSGGADEPGVYELGTHAPDELPRAGLEATTFHETWPGHHLQGKVALQRAGLHPVLRYFFNSGMGEGWALYSERLADELGLYSGDIDRIGMLSNDALRAARLVVDPGIHVLGWSRQRALDYMLAHTAESESSAAWEIDRYIALPGQSTAYMTGALEIRRLREMARERLGDRFDVRAFHDRVLEDGTINLAMLRRKIEGWIAAPQAAAEPTGETESRPALTARPPAR
jgi:uncharacterized protein (DUF885 family)